MTLAEIPPWLLLVLAPHQSTAPSAADGPPGLILVAGGATTIGSTIDEVEKLVRVREELNFALAGETPQFELVVEDFYLMPTEVTNEQYLEFVLATRSKPPRSWGEPALQAGQATFIEEQGRARQAAKKAGQAFELQSFDPETWWDENWKGASWEAQEDELAHPVVFVNFAEAQTYARWAGLRLMTEFEFQRAARAGTGRLYPWGDKWDDKRFCQSLHSGRDTSVAVGSFPSGVSAGIHDLAGNVWEWTASPFTPYPGYKALRFIGKAKRVIDCLAPFDPEQQVTVGGSFQMDFVGVRSATRRNTAPEQSTNALGFRCAASTQAGLDAVTVLIQSDLALATLGPATLEPRQTTILRNWSLSAAAVRVPGYEVITGYEHVLACPVRGIPASSTAELTADSVKSGPVFLGLLDVPRPLSRPELAAGSYFVAWRAAAGLPAPPAEKKTPERGVQQGAAPFGNVAGFSAGKDCFLFYDRRGVPTAAMETGAPEVERPRACGLALEPCLAPEPGAERREVDTLRVTLALPSSTNKSKCFLFELALEVERNSYDANWR